jgi:hypothetical protein
MNEFKKIEIMKTIILSIVLLTYCLSWGQIKTQKELIEEAVIAAWNKTENEKTSVGTIKIKEKAYVIDFDANLKYESLREKLLKRKDNIKIAKPIAIDSVKIDLQEGMLEYIKVYLKDGTIYSNTKAPIGIIYTGERFFDMLYNELGTQFILFQDIIEVDTKKRFGFLPNEETFTLYNISSKGLNFKNLKKDSDLNSLINFVAYSDLLGLLGNQPNALVHFEANAKFYIHRRNAFKSFIYIFPSFQPSFNYNKLDSKFDSIKVVSNKINPTEIFRRHNYAVGIDLTVFKYNFRPANTFEINTGYQYLSSRMFVNDGVSENEVIAVSHVKSIGSLLKSKVLENFGIELGAKYIWQLLNKSAFYDRMNNNLMEFKGSIYYYPPTGKGSDKIFIRFSNFIALESRQGDFSQLQIGFSKSLSSKK